MFADIDHAHGDVKDDLNSWGEWVIKETGAAGFRFDAVKHIDKNFIAQFVKHVREFVGKPLFCVRLTRASSADDPGGRGARDVLTHRLTHAVLEGLVLRVLADC